MERASQAGPAASGPVKVSRNGNARTLTVPAEIAAAAHIEPGDLFMVEAVDGDLFYRRVDRGRPAGRFVGEGAQRHLVLPRGATIPAGPDPVPHEPIDWDF